MLARCALLTGLAVLLGGCVVPIPTSSVAAPSVRGQVINAKTGAPVDFAAVTVREFKEASVLTKRDGTFATDSITRSRPLWVWNPFAGANSVELKLRVGRPGFEKRDQVVTWISGEQSVVHLPKPIRLRPKGFTGPAADGPVE
jgi:hypothetical protein